MSQLDDDPTTLKPEDRHPNRRFSLSSFGVWILIFGAALGALRMVGPGVREKDLLPLAAGVTLLTIALSGLVIFFHRVCGAARVFFGGLVGAVVASGSGLVLSTVLISTSLRTVMGPLSRIEGIIVIVMPILGAFFGGLGGCFSAALCKGWKWSVVAMGISAAGPTIMLVFFYGGGRSDIVWGLLTVLVGIIGGVASRSLIGASNE